MNTHPATVLSKGQPNATRPVSQPTTSEHNTVRLGTIEDKIRLFNENTARLRLEELSQGFAFMISLAETPNLYYYEYADGRIEVYTLGDKSKTPIQTLTGPEADAVRKQANIK